MIKRRRWRSKVAPNLSLCSNLSFLAKGSKMTAELAAFLKGTYWDTCGSLRTIARYNGVNYQQMLRQYKEYSSDFR